MVHDSEKFRGRNFNSLLSRLVSGGDVETETLNSCTSTCMYGHGKQNMSHCTDRRVAVHGGNKIFNTKILLNVQTIFLLTTSHGFFPAIFLTGPVI